MQGPLGTAQTEQWSWILQTVWGWVWGGLSWIIVWQGFLFRFVVSGSSFWEAFFKFIFLFFPTTVLVAGGWGTMVSLYTIPFRSGRGRFPPAALMSGWGVAAQASFYWVGLGAFTVARPPTMAELLADLTGYAVNPLALVLLLLFFLFIIIGGSFACIQVLNEAIRTRAVGQIVSMVLVEITVALFEVLFLYRELIDAITPWLAQQGFQLGIVGTLGLAFLGWTGVRGMTWFLFGRFGTPALISILGRQAMEGVGAARAAVAADAEFWRGPINALKAEHEWFKKEAQHLVELLTLPVLQLLAAGFNFGAVVILGKPHFTLPFRSLEQVLTSTCSAGGKRAEAGAT